MNQSTVVSAELSDTLRQTRLTLDMPNNVENILKKTINFVHIFFWREYLDMGKMTDYSVRSYFHYICICSGAQQKFITFFLAASF